MRAHDQHIDGRIPDREVRDATIAVLRAALEAAQDASTELPFEWLPQGNIGCHMIQTRLVHPDDGREFFATVVAFLSSDRQKMEAISQAWITIAGLCAGQAL